MAQESPIEWTDATWNPVRGCSRVSEGCRHCYAEKTAGRFCGEGLPYEGLVQITRKGPRWTGKVVLVPEQLDAPLRWRKPRRIFVNSMSDLFHENLSDESIDRVFAVMALARRHTFQVLTKRPERMRAYLDGLTLERLRVWMNRAADGGEHRPGAYNLTSIDGASAKARFLAGDKTVHMRTGEPPYPNFWLGTSIEDQKTAKERIPHLLATRAAVRFLSCEPLLGPINLELAMCECPWPENALQTRHLLPCPADQRPGPRWGIDWVIVGGENCPDARPMHPQWARSLRNQCVAAGVPFFFKQWGSWEPCAESDWHGLGCLGTPQQVALSPNGETAGGFLGGLAERKRAEGWRPMSRVGKKTAGRLLDGREWNEMPSQRAEAANR